MNSSIFAGGFIGLLLIVFPVEAGESIGVKPGQTVQEVLDSHGKGAASSRAEFPTTGQLLLRLALTVGSVSLLGFGSLFFLRKWFSQRGTLHSTGEIEVAGRAALSPKHLVFVLRVADQRIVVGVSGDRMSPLAVVEDGKARRPQAAVPESAEGGRKTVGEADLMPYRRQMDRLRGLFRGRFEGNEDLSLGEGGKEP